MNEQEGGLVQNLYYYIQQRVTSDWTTDPSTAIILAIVTCGIYGLYIFYKLMERRDQHFARMANVVNTSVALVKEKAAAAGKSELISQDLAQLDMVQREMFEQSRERGAVLWLVLGILTGICTIIGYYFIMEDLARHDQLEAQYFTLMSGILTKLGLSAQESQAAPTIPERNFVTFLLLSIVTCGIYGFYWIYVMILDGNNHVEAQVQWEDYVYSALAAA
ncbi:MAG: DUF4234 domain-containing protein [Actinobacteria bacterium]|nr:DUF4234 domain-containing protein [Actinomycetota bacterium]